MNKDVMLDFILSAAKDSSISDAGFRAMVLEVSNSLSPASVSSRKTYTKQYGSDTNTIGPYGNGTPAPWILDSGT